MAMLATIVVHSLVALPMVCLDLCLCWLELLVGGALTFSLETVSFEVTGSIEAFPNRLPLPMGSLSIVLNVAVAFALGAQNLGPYKTSRVARIAHKTRAGPSRSSCKGGTSMVPPFVRPLFWTAKRWKLDLSNDGAGACPWSAGSDRRTRFAILSDAKTKGNVPLLVAAFAPFFWSVCSLCSLSRKTGCWCTKSEATM